MSNEQHNMHVIARKHYIREVRKMRYERRSYLFKVSRMTQLNSLKQRGDTKAYEWLKSFWRKELTA